LTLKNHNKMKINKLYIENFKSFGKLEIVFQPINLLIGANASGKSNLIFLFEFLKNIQIVGIERAVSEMGGFKSLLNLNAESRSFTIRVEMEGNELLSTEKISEVIEILKKRTHITYKIEGNQKGNHFQIREDIRFTEIFVERNPITEAEIILREDIYGVVNKFGKFEIFEHLSETKPLSNGIVPKLFNFSFQKEMLHTLNQEYKNRSVLEYGGIFIPTNLFQFGIYDIEPQRAKTSNLNANMDVLRKDGSNLTQVVNQILKKDEDTVQQFIASVGGVLDFIEAIKVERFENLLFLKVKEIYNKTFTDAALISDGTASVIAMIVALYHQPFQISFFEEPEKAIHPALIEQLVERFYEETEYMDRQLFITTHSPQMLKYFYKRSALQNIFTVKRTKKTAYNTQVNTLSTDPEIVSLLEILGAEASFIQKLIS
jgi:predicted ATPase